MGRQEGLLRKDTVPLRSTTRKTSWKSLSPETAEPEKGTEMPPAATEQIWQECVQGPCPTLFILGLVPAL